MVIARFTRSLLPALLLLGGLAASPAHANAYASSFESEFDRAFGTAPRAPRSYLETSNDPLERRVALLANGDQGRIGVAAIDLATGASLAVLGDQRFPMASTSKVAIAATFLEGVDQGRYSLDDLYPMLVPVPSAPLSSAAAPVREGERLSARQLIDLMIARSNNPATDAILRAVGGTKAVNDWARRAGIADFRLDRDIATLVRDDGKVDPALHIDVRDSASPRAMASLLAGLHQGRWLSAESRAVLIGAMERCVTGKRRIPALLPETVQVAHKTGSLSNTSSDVGIVTLPDGRAIALAIYVTGQESRLAREARIASIARAIVEGYGAEGNRLAVSDARPDHASRAVLTSRP